MDSTLATIDIQVNTLILTTIWVFDKKAMSNIRQTAVAGLFYPGNPSELENTVDAFLKNANQPKVTPKAIIAPHAGYIYSGQIAAQAYKTLEPIKHRIKRVILAGPSHRVPFYGCALSSADFFETPLGKIPVDKLANQELINRRLAKEMDTAHALEHSLEVHLPFLQKVLNDFMLVPIVVGEADAEEVVSLFDFFWNNDENFFVISSDLSHFHSYAEAQLLDQNTSESILHFDSEHIGPAQACGCRPVNGLLNLAKKYHLSVVMLDQKNSGDTAGDKNRVVGYGAYAFY